MSYENTAENNDSMSNEKNWEQYCSQVHVYSELGLRIDLSRSALAEKGVSSFQEETKRALSDLKALEAGEIANPDENRMVGHYWLRAPELAPDETITEPI